MHCETSRLVDTAATPRVYGGLAASTEAHIGEKFRELGDAVGQRCLLVVDGDYNIDGRARHF